MFGATHKPCVKCRKVFANGQLQNGVCYVCRADANAEKVFAGAGDYWERGLEDASIGARVEAAMPKIEADLALLGAFHAFTLERPDGPADARAPATRHRDLPAWRQHVRRLVIVDDE